MLHLRISAPSNLRDEVVQLLESDPAVSSLAVLRGASLRPVGDLIFADVAREAVNEIVDQLRRVGVQREGTVHIDPVNAWLSQSGFDAEVRTPGSSTDAVVWVDVVQRAYEESELNWTYLSFMIMSTLIAGIAIVLDSQVLLIGAMVLGPEFGAIAALGVALVRRRGLLLTLAARTLAIGFVVAIVATTLASLLGRAVGAISVDDITGPRPGTGFIYSPDGWSILVAVMAAAAGVLSLTSSKVIGLAGVFISVTTLPAAGNIGLGLAFGAWHEVRGSALQLLVNITGMALAGWLTLALQHAIWSRMSLRRTRQMAVAESVRR
jgi:uncharacterized hydrophobic protein (TIGR00271 family)